MYYLAVSLFFDVTLKVAGDYFVAAGIGMQSVGEEGLYQFATLIDEAGGEVDVLKIFIRLYRTHPLPPSGYSP